MIAGQGSRKARSETPGRRRAAAVAACCPRACIAVAPLQRHRRIFVIVRSHLVEAVFPIFHLSSWSSFRGQL